MSAATDPTPVVYVFGEYELNPLRFELRRGGVSLKLEPKVFDLLCHLVANRDRVVTTRELFDALWPQEFVSPSALSRCVMEARKALGDDGVAQRAIKTVHGRGYRFVAPIEEKSAAEPRDKAVGAATANPDVAIGDDGAPPALSTRQGSPPKARLRRLALALAVVVLSVALLDPLAPAGPPAADPGAAATRPIRLAFLPISTDDGDAELQLVGVSMTDLLHARLAEMPDVIVRPPEYSAQLGLRALSLVEFARQTGVPYVVTGTLARRSADRGYLTLMLHQVDQPAHLRNVSLGGYDIHFLAASTDLSAFLRTRDAIVGRMVRLLLPALDVARVEGHRPASSEAYRLYLLAAGRFVQQVTCDETALDLVQQSLAIDPAYPQAWLLLGWAHYNEVGACGQDGSHYARALEAAQKAAGLAPGLPEPLALTAAVLVETGRAGEAYDLLLRARARFPAAPEIRYALAYALTYAGFLGQATQQLEELFVLDPMYLTSAGWTPNALLYNRQWDRFLALLPGTEAPIFRYYRAYAELQRGRADVARDTLEPAFRLNPDDVFARLSLALLALVERHPEDARTILNELARQREARGSRDGEFTYKQAQLLSLAGDPPAALRQLELAIDQGFYCVECFESDRAFRASARDPEFRRVFAKARDRHRAFGRRFALSR
jgi:DNA-binding winged helix-turn-helix (wHTH) protein/tetratricopeptide (TPR) repeat protein